MGVVLNHKHRTHSDRSLLLHYLSVVYNTCKYSAIKFMLDDVYADGTPAEGNPFPIDAVPVAKLLSAASVRAPPKKIASNPSAATVCQ